jgi:hypothetical protein
MSKVLIGCEESQIECRAFRAIGHEAYSCDLLPCSGSHPEWHLPMDVRTAILLHSWDIIILHPPCTYTALCGNRWYSNSRKRLFGALFTKSVFELAKSVCNHVALEQPATIMQRYIGKKSQIIQPWEYGHGETKSIWLWLSGLPLLRPTNIVAGRNHRIWLMSPSPDRSKLRSKSYPGIAKAMANQWSLYYD